jgi:hypothetical protein
VVRLSRSRLGDEEGSGCVENSEFNIRNGGGGWVVEVDEEGGDVGREAR